MDIEIRDLKDRCSHSKGCGDNLQTQPKEIPYEIEYQEDQNIRNGFPVFGREALYEGFNSNVGMYFQGYVSPYKGDPDEEDTGHLFGPWNDPSNDIPIGYLKKDKQRHYNNCESCKPIEEL
jgi:hypothetical protein